MQAFIYLPGVVTLMAAVCPKIVWRFDENVLNDAIMAVTVSVVLDTMFRRRHSESEHENWYS
jgi:hydrogenase-4 membrane subunit HyfE